MCKKRNLTAFYNMFSKNYNKNDILIIKLFNRIVSRKNKRKNYVNRFGEEGSYGFWNQICTSRI